MSDWEELIKDEFNTTTLELISGYYIADSQNKSIIDTYWINVQNQTSIVSAIFNTYENKYGWALYPSGIAHNAYYHPNDYFTEDSAKNPWESSMRAYAGMQIWLTPSGISSKWTGYKGAYSEGRRWFRNSNKF